MSEETGRPTDRESWERRYVEGPLPWDSGEPDAHLARALERYGVRPGKELEIGCGTGTNAVWMAQRGFEVTALDLSETAIARARAKAAEAGVSCAFHTADFLVDPVPGAPFAFAHDRGCFHVFADAGDRARFAARVAECLAPGALWHSLIGSCDGPPRDTGPPRLGAAEVVTAVEPRFEILELSATAFDQGPHRDARAWFLVARRREP